MALPTRSSFLRLTNTSGGYPAEAIVRAKGRQSFLNQTSGGYPTRTARGLGYDGHVYVSNEWKSFTNGYVYVNGAWKELDELNINVSGTWNQ